MSALALVVAPSVTAGFSYRYGLPLLVLLPPAGVLAADLACDALGGVQARRRRLYGLQGDAEYSSDAGRERGAARAEAFH